MEKLKDPKIIAAIVGVILGLAMAAFAPVKEVTVEVCQKVLAEAEAKLPSTPALPANTDDLK